MACELLVAKALSEQMVTFCQLNIREELSAKLENRNFRKRIYSYINAIWKLLGILSRPQWANHSSALRCIALI